MAAFSTRDGIGRGVVEVVDEVGVGGDQGDAVFGRRGELERFDQGFVVGDGAGAFYGGEGGGVVERSWEGEG